MIESRPDWCLSRQRLWGVPIPVFLCKNCDTVLIDETINKHIESLIKQHGSTIWFEKTVEELLPKKPHCDNCSQTSFYKEEDRFWGKSSCGSTREKRITISCRSVFRRQ
ncbi:class I tRNA ligase family protein [Chlamydiota bacterium]